MKKRTRYRGQEWTVEHVPGSTLIWDAVHAFVLQDIRDELRELNALLHCSNFVAIPGVLRGIRKNTTKRRKVKRHG